MTSSSECKVCGESFRFYNCLDKYFHYDRHFNEFAFQVTWISSYSKSDLKRFSTLHFQKAGCGNFEDNLDKKEENYYLVQDLRLRIAKNKKLVFEDPIYKVPPCSKEWLEDKDLARLQQMIYIKEKRMKKKKIISCEAADKDVNIGSFKENT